MQAAIGGQAVTQVYEGEKRFDLTVRWAPAVPQGPRRPSATSPVATPDGAQVPLGQIAQIVKEEGPSLIYREDSRRYAPVKFSVRGRDLASTINEAREKIDGEGEAPVRHAPGVGGRDQPAQRGDGPAGLLIVPLTLLLIAHAGLRRGEELDGHAHRARRHSGRLHRAASLALLVTGTNFSISAAMGFISIFGIAIQDAHPRRHLLPAPAGHEGHRLESGGARGRRAAAAPGAHDDVRRDARADAGRAVRTASAPRRRSRSPSSSSAAR